MKKVSILFAIAIFYAIGICAQEVHGVESKMVCTYNCNPNGSWESWGRGNNPWFSYEFTNLNSIPVAVEVELYTNPSTKYKDGATPRLMATKSFVLKKGESYIWKNGGDHGIDIYSSHGDYFVKYKAYKLL